MYKKGIDAYKEISHTNLSASEFEKAWFESVVMVLNRIKDGSHYNAVEVHVKLIEVADGLGYISENLNPALNSQHRTLLKISIRCVFRLLMQRLHLRILNTWILSFKV